MQSDQQSLSSSYILLDRCSKDGGWGSGNARWTVRIKNPKKTNPGVAQALLYP